jgi:hypothetical protein
MLEVVVGSPLGHACDLYWAAMTLCFRSSFHAPSSSRNRSGRSQQAIRRVCSQVHPARGNPVEFLREILGVRSEVLSGDVRSPSPKSWKIRGVEVHAPCRMGPFFARLRGLAIARLSIRGGFSWISGLEGLPGFWVWRIT